MRPLLEPLADIWRWLRPAPACRRRACCCCCRWARSPASAPVLMPGRRRRPPCSRPALRRFTWNAGGERPVGSCVSTVSLSSAEGPAERSYVSVRARMDMCVRKV